MNQPLTWVYEGQLVEAPIRGRQKFRSSDIGPRLRCVVVCAMGDTARVTNTLHGIDAWFAISELRAVNE